MHGKHHPFLCTLQEARCILTEASRLYVALQRFWRTIQGFPGKNMGRKGKGTPIFDKNVPFSHTLPSPAPFPESGTKKRAPSSDGTRFLPSADSSCRQGPSAHSRLLPATGSPCRQVSFAPLVLSSACGVVPARGGALTALPRLLCPRKSFSRPRGLMPLQVRYARCFSRPASGIPCRCRYFPRPCFFRLPSGQPSPSGTFRTPVFCLRRAAHTARYALPSACPRGSSGNGKRRGGKALRRVRPT